MLVWASLGGVCGSLLLGLLTMRWRLSPLTIGAMLASTLAVIAFGFTGADLVQLSVIAAVAGFCTNAGVVGLYALIARTFPTAIRAGATGFVIGVGRGGSAMAPALAGWLFSIGFGLPGVAILLGLGSAVAGAALLSIGRRDAD